jgi:hypothetical protein
VAELLRVEEIVAALSASAKESGYELHRLLAKSPAEAETENRGGVVVVADESAVVDGFEVEGGTPEKRTATVEVDDDGYE